MMPLTMPADRAAINNSALKKTSSFCFLWNVRVVFMDVAHRCQVEKVGNARLFLAHIFRTNVDVGEAILEL